MIASAFLTVEGLWKEKFSDKVVMAAARVETTQFSMLSALRVASQT